MTGSLPPTEPPEATEPAPIDQPDQPEEPDGAGFAGSVTGEWVEVYQPDGAPQQEQVLAPATMSSRSGVVVVVLFVVSLLLVVIGSVTPLFKASLVFGGVALTNVTSLLSADAWQLTTSDDSFTTDAPTHTQQTPVPIGYPLVLVVLLLLVVVALWLRAGQQPGSARAARPVGLAAAMFLAGLVVALGMFEVAWDKFGTLSEFGGLQATIGVGYWMLVAATVVAIAAAVLGYRVPGGQPAARPVFVDPGQWPQQPPAPDAQQVPPGQPAQWPVVAVIPADERTNW